MSDDRCIVCGDKAARPLTAPLTRCPSCQRPCHSRCSGRRKDSPCDLCRKNAPTSPKKEAGTTNNKRQNEHKKQNSTQVSTKNITLPTQRRTSAPSRTTPPRRESLNSSTLSVKRLAQSKNKGARTSQSGASIETDKRVDGVQGPGTADSTATKVADVQEPDTADNTATKVADVQGHSYAPNTSAQPVDVLQAPPPAQEHLKSPEDCTELNNPDYHPAMRDVIITGAENVIIPVSTLDLFFRRFDMLQKQLDDLKSLENQSLASSSTDIENSKTRKIANNKELTTRESVLEGLISDQNVLLENLNVKCELLLEENSSLKSKLDALDKILSISGGLQCAHLDGNKDEGRINPILCNAGSSTHIVKNCSISSASRPCVGVPVAGSGNHSAESSEIILNGIFKKDKDVTDEITNEVVFAVLSTVLPSLTRESILGVRDLRPRRVFDEAEETGEGLAPRLGAPRSCVVNLRSADLVREVMKAKRKLSNNYLTSSDIKSELLGPASAACMPNSKIFINEMMPQEKFLVFKSLRPIAQGLGFKYVWHAGGKFLARRRTGERAHVFASAADLQAIQTACQSVPKKHLPNINSPNDVATSSVKGQGTAQVVKSATTS